MDAGVQRLEVGATPPPLAGGSFPIWQTKTQFAQRPSESSERLDKIPCMLPDAGL